MSTIIFIQAISAIHSLMEMESYDVIRLIAIRTNKIAIQTPVMIKHDFLVHPHGVNCCIGSIGVELT
jgi:hypothetical protein